MRVKDICFLQNNLTSVARCSVQQTKLITLEIIISEKFDTISRHPAALHQLALVSSEGALV